MTGIASPELVAKFRATALDRLTRLNQGVVTLEQSPGDTQTADTVMREIHTIKGEAKMLGFADASTAAHRTEALLLLARRAGFRMSTELLDAVFAGLDLLTALVQASAEGPTVDSATFLARAERLLATSDPKPATAPEPPRGRPVEAQPASTAAEHGDHAAHATSATNAPSAVLPSGAASRPSPSDAFVRITIARIDTLTGLAGELANGHAGWAATLERLAQATTSWLKKSQVLADHLAMATSGRSAQGIDTESAINLARSQAEEILGLGQSMERTLHEASEHSFDYGNKVEDLEQRVRELRLLPVGDLLARFPRAVRDLAHEQGKEVSVELAESDAEVDKRILDQLDDALLHLVRNAFDHGLETPHERSTKGKSPAGRITLGARQRGARVLVTIRDDGRGIDPELLRRTAVARGVVLSEQAGALSQDELYALLFRPGFTTRTEVTDVSGRGVGLDVVRQRIEALGGHVRIESEPGRGTTFSLSVPVTVAIMPVLVFTCGGVLYGVPAEAALAVTEVDDAALVRVGGGYALRLGGELTPVVELCDLVAPGAPPQRPSAIRRAVVVSEHVHRVGLLVDEFVGERRLVQRPLDPFIEQVKLLTGTALLTNGGMVLLLNVPELLRAAAGLDRALGSAQPAAHREDARTVLVVDDSEIIRDMLVMTLRSRGLTVIEAVNGREALERIREAKPHLVITDLEMPVLDGFGLLAALRTLPQAASTPVVVLSSRGSAEDKQRAADLGADAYVVKTEFSEERIMRALERFLVVGKPGAS